MACLTVPSLARPLAGLEVLARVGRTNLGVQSASCLQLQVHLVLIIERLLPGDAPTHVERCTVPT
eukprot:1177257-Prorocentrum_minimum.AAC.2